MKTTLEEDLVVGVVELLCLIVRYLRARRFLTKRLTISSNNSNRSKLPFEKIPIISESVARKVAI